MNTGTPTKPVTKETVTYSFGVAAQHIHIFDTLPLDAVLTHQSKMVGFLLKTGTALPDVELPPVPRGVKDILRS
jgi:hypothetical protein